MSKESVFVPLGLKNLKDVHELSSFKKEDEFPYNGLWVFTGSQGNGKTLLLMHVLREMINEYPKAIIVSNISIYGIPSYPYRGLSDFDEYTNGKDGIIFVIDEIQSLFTALVNEKMPPEAISVWSQNRKNRRVILGTSQRFKRIAKPLREQTKLLYVCHAPFLSVRSYTCFDASLIDDEGEYKGPKEHRHFYIPSFKVMTSYNTLEVVKKSKTIISRRSAGSNFIRELKDYLSEVENNDSNI